MRHAADSRWQPGRRGGWGELEGSGGGGEDRSMWHMWVAVGGEDGEIAVWTAVCAHICIVGARAHSVLCQHPNIMLVKKNNT